VVDGEVVGESFHRVFGGPHAEVLALAEAGDRARGATVYVSLEPCSHVGKTPPCTLALIEAGVDRVVYGASDPTPNGRGGAEVLKGAGVEVAGPVYSRDRARLENPSFFHWAERGTLWLQIKLATSTDGRIAAAPGVRTQISGPEANRWVQSLRAGVDAILIGRTTALVDDPLLTVREVPIVRPPKRVVLDSTARIAPQAAMLHAEGGAVVIFVGDAASSERTIALERAGALVHRVPLAEGPESGVDLGEVMRILTTDGVRSVLCEGGGVLASALIRQELAQRFHRIVAPNRLGPNGVPALAADLTFPTEAWRPFDALRDLSARPALGQDTVVSFRREY